MTVYWATGAVFLAWIAMSYAGSRMLHLQGPEWYMFMGLLGALGLTASALFIYFQTKFRREPSTGSPSGGPAGGSLEIDQLIREAGAKFSQSSVGQGQTIANLPLVFVIGDSQTAKTTSILQSGLMPELLAGQVYLQNDVVPTRSANVWFARGFAFVEAGGAVLGDPANWVRLVKTLQPGKLKSLVGKGGQAPRAVLLCVSLEAFLTPGASGTLEAASRYIGARLGEISQLLGISFPVYVLFTKADRLPFFADYVRTFSNDEAAQVFGATLPMRDPQSGVYAEEETRRLNAAFSNLFVSLCDNRVVYLPREDDAEKLPGAYEFPREFRKLRAGLVQFLVDICRPSQLRVSPFLRGFYFSGVRPVVMSDVAVSRGPDQQSQSLEEAGGATRMFRVGMQEEMRAQQASAQSQPSARKVPQWTFLTHLFHGILLQDSAAMAASGANVKTSLLRRVLLALAASLCLLICAAFTVSYFGNRALSQTALAASQSITTTDSNEPNLKRLETLRQSLEQLTAYEEQGHPFRLGFGLYTGTRILPDVRQLYYNKFRDVLFGDTQSTLLAFLRNSPKDAGPNDDYGFAYDTLKGYLLTSAEYQRTADKTLQSYLGNILYTRWQAGKENQLSPERSALARKQFDFYSRDLHNGNPYSKQSDTVAVERTRLYLSKFSGVQRVYHFLLGEVAKGHPAASFNDVFKGSVEVVTSSHPVEFAFTKPGADQMLKSVRAARFGGEQWVLGSYQAQSVDKAAMESGIMDVYSRDYIKAWRMVLKTSRVNAYKNLADAGAKLNTLTGSEAPLLALFWWASQNTSVDVPNVAAAFRPVQLVVPPSPVQQYVVAPNQAYNNGLIKLQGTVAQAAALPNGPDPAAAAATQSESALARQSTRQITASFPVDNEAHLEGTVNELMLEPITNVEALTKGLGAAEANAKAKGFCSALDPLTRKFPFNPNADPEVTLDELNGIFKAKDGKLWQLAEALKPYLVCAGSDCASVPNAPAPVDARFLAFFKQAVAFSRALYAEAGTDPNFRYTLRPVQSEQVDEFALSINGDSAHLNGGGQKIYVWPGPGAPAFKLDLKLAGGTPFGVQDRDHLWAVFRFFADADTTTRSGAGYNFRWNFRQGKGSSAPIVKGRALSYEFFVDTNGAPAVFSKDFLAGLKCIPTVSRQ